MFDLLTSDSLASWLVTGVLMLLALMFFKKPRGLPPGPIISLPLVGHIPFMGRDLLGKLRRMRKQYGDIFHMYLGTKLVIVINGHDALKEAFLTHGDVLSERPEISPFIDQGGRRGVLSSSGELWREQRKFALTTLRGFGMGRSLLQGRIQEEVQEFLAAVEKENAQAFDMSHYLHISVSNVICSIVFGKRFGYMDPLFKTFLKAMEANIHLGLGSTLLNWMPFLKKLPGDLGNFKKRMDNVALVRNKLTEPFIEEHLKNFQPDQINDFIDAYIKEMKEKEVQGADTTITRPHLWRLIQDLFVAGTETTATTIRWALVFLLRHPDLQERLFQELQDKVGTGRLPAMEDRAELPLLEAFILEVQRRANIVPLSLPHGVKEEFQLRGFRVPKDAVVFPNLDSVLNDPQVWGDPEVFRPERFLQDGQVVKPEEFVPFSLGPRVCLGEALAKMELFLFLSAMIQRFRYELPESEAPPPVEGILGITYKPQTFKLRAVPRF